MNILFVSSEYPPQTGFGGIGTYTRLMARTLFARGHRVEVIARSETGDAYEHTDEGVRVHRVGPGEFPLPKGRFLYRYRELRRQFHYQALVRMAYAGSVNREYGRLAGHRPFDIIECAECGAEGFYLRPAGATRLVVRLHTPFSYIARLNHWGLGYFDLRKIESLERSVAQRAHAVSSPSIALKKVLETKWGLKNTVCYPNPMEAKEYAEKAGRGNYIIYTGRVEYLKGVHVLLKAYSQYVQAGGELPLLLAGAPGGSLKNLLSYEQLIENLISTLGLSQRVRWIKKAGREDIRRILQEACAAVYPSLWENLPYACLEAMASGVPVIASRCGGIGEIITDGENGLLADPFSQAGLLSALNQVTGDAALAVRLGGAGRRRVLTAYDPETAAEAAERFYRGILNG